MDVSVMLVKVGVDMGDHAETVTKAVEVDIWETVGSMVDRLLSEPAYEPGNPGKRALNPKWRLEVRAVEPAVR